MLDCCAWPRLRSHELARSRRSARRATRSVGPAAPAARNDLGIASRGGRSRTAADPVAELRDEHRVDASSAASRASARRGSRGTPNQHLGLRDRGDANVASRLLCRASATTLRSAVGANAFGQDVGIEDDHCRTVRRLAPRRERDAGGARGPPPSSLNRTERSIGVRRSASSPAARPLHVSLERMRASSSIDRSLLGCARTKPALHAFVEISDRQRRHRALAASN